MEERALGPVIGLGTSRTFDADVQLARRVVDATDEAGYRLYDTSPMYGSEEALGLALEPRRVGSVLATKIWTESVEEGRAQYENQVRWFGRVEIEQVHNLVSWEEHLTWLEEEREAGRIERIGVTHWQASARELLPLAQELGVAVLVMRALGDKSRLPNPPAAEELEPIREFGVETWPQALLKWALSDERIAAVIPATRDPEHARENAAAGTPPWLGPDER